MNEILDRSVVFSTPWFNILAKTLAGWESPYYVVDGSDYVTVLPTTASGGVVLVRQFRPALEDFSLELPSGHIEKGESPEEAARRELLEETGYTAGKLEFLGEFAGLGQAGDASMVLPGYRIANCGGRPCAGGRSRSSRVWFFRLANMIRQARFNHALHVAQVSLWMLHDGTRPGDL